MARKGVSSGHFPAIRLRAAVPLPHPAGVSAGLFVVAVTAAWLWVRATDGSPGDDTGVQPGVQPASAPASANAEISRMEQRVFQDDLSRAGARLRSCSVV